MNKFVLKIVVYIATSKDGFIADEKGTVDWLPQTLAETGGQDYGYHEFYDSVDAITMGRKTYEQILGFGDWPYTGKASYIFTRNPKETRNQEIEFISGDIQKFIDNLEKRGIKKLWIVGGSDLLEAFYTQGRIDEFIVTVFPTVLEKGISLKTLRDALQKSELYLEHSIDYGDGVRQDYFKIPLRSAE